MSEKQCEFCDRIAMSNRVFQFWKERDEQNLKHEITVAIVERKWIAGTPKQNAGKLTDYRYRGLGFKLNYCPTCGRKLKKKETNQ